MTEILVTTAADRDVDLIFQTYRDQLGPDAIASFHSDLDAAYARLSRFPESGAPRPTLGRGLRIVVLRPYVLIYRYDALADRVELLRVLHGRRDLSAEMDREPPTR